jgi:hypothetical protein
MYNERSKEMSMLYCNSTMFHNCRIESKDEFIFITERFNTAHKILLAPKLSC